PTRRRLELMFLPNLVQHKLENGFCLSQGGPQCIRILAGELIRISPRRQPGHEKWQACDRRKVLTAPFTGLKTKWMSLNNLQKVATPLFRGCQSCRIAIKRDNDPCVTLALKLQS